MYDLVVVGSGPAGAMCAREAAVRGLHVILIEKERIPRNKLCGGALSPRIMDTVDFDISKAVQHEVHCAVIHAPPSQRIEIIREDVRAFTVKRDEFDALLVDEARKEGVEVVDDIKVLSVEQLKTGIRVLSHGDSFKGHLLVGADGVNSIVARSTGIRRKWGSDRIALCIAADIPFSPSEVQQLFSIDADSNRLALEIYLWAVEYGYGWCFPRQDEISLGIGYKMKHGVRNLRAAWKAFVHRFEKEKGVEIDTSGQKAHRIPLARLDSRLVARRTMLVGDAAGLVSPITGEGIYYAIRSGIIAGQVAYESVRDKNPLRIKEYERRLGQALGTEFSAANFVSNRIYKSSRNVNLICEMAENDSTLQDYIVDLALGIRSINRIRFDIAKHMLRHYPRKALKLLR